MRELGEPAAFPGDPRRSRMSLGITIRDRGRFAKLVFPGFLISIGAGQVIPFLNLFVQGKFGLDLTQLNAVFALTSLGTVLAILIVLALRNGMGLANITGHIQTGVLGILLILSVMVPMIRDRLSRLFQRGAHGTPD